MFVIVTNLIDHPERRALEARVATLEAAMSEFGDLVRSLTASVDAAIGRVQSDVSALQAKIDELQVKIDTNTATPEELAEFRATQAKIDALDPTKEDTLPEEPPPV